MSKKRGKKAEKEAVASGSESAADAGTAQPPAPADASARPGFWDNVHVPDLVKHRIEVVKRHSRLSKRMRAKLRRLLPWAIAAGLLTAAFMWEPSNAFLMWLLSNLMQLVVAIFYMIVQFGALFWFMSRSKIERIRPEDPKIITFDDYWGQPRLKRLVRQWLGLLSDREQFVEMGGRYINGLLLYGPPGTGKTMLAKAMSGEAGVAFISIEGSGFKAMFWGVDVMKMIWFVRKARKLARRYGACIAYIDEIDAVGASRGGVMGGGGGEGGGFGGMSGGTGALTRLLYEMDGIDEKTRKEKIQGRLYKLMGKKPPERNWHVLFMGSTNRPGVLDAALTRPGRFDQLIQVDLPDASGRREIVEGYLRTISHDDTVDVEAIVIGNQKATPAQIMAALTKDAVRIALFDHRRAISQDDVEKAFLQQYMGIENPIEDMPEGQRYEIAIHEAGHTVAQHYLLPDTRITHVTILRRGGALGFMLPDNEQEMHSFPLERFTRDIMVGMAGQEAMRLIFGKLYTGPTGDYASVRRRLFMLYQSGQFGPPLSGWESLVEGQGSGTAEEAKLLRKVWVDLQSSTFDLLRAHEDEVRAIANHLMEHNSMSTKHVLALLGPNGKEPTGTELPAPSGNGGSPGAAAPAPTGDEAEVAGEPVDAKTEAAPSGAGDG